MIRDGAVTVNGSDGAARIIRDPLRPSPETKSVIACPEGAVARIARAAHHCQALARIALSRIDVLVRAKLLCHRSFFGSPSERDRAKPHGPSKLHPEVSQTSKTLDGYQVSGARLRVSEGVEGGYAGAKQGGGFGERDAVGDKRERLDRNDH